MPAEQFPFLGRMDLDDPEQVVPKGFHTDARNVIWRGAEGDMRAENFPGTRSLFTPDCVAPAIVGYPALPDGTNGVPYSYSFTLTGSMEFSLSNKVAPSWMT